MAASPEVKASSLAVRRLQSDLKNLQRSHNPQIAVRPSEDNLLQWHFVLHSLGADTPYHGGCYHGKIIFPPEYPHAPPAIMMMTPSGRLETARRLCLSMTDFHPESWNPAWSVETILVGLLSFFISDVEKGYGAISISEERRKALASESGATNAKDAEFRTLFPEFLSEVDFQAASLPDSQTQALVPASGGNEVANAAGADSARTSSNGTASPARQGLAPEQELSSVLLDMPSGDTPLLASGGADRAMETRGEGEGDEEDDDAPLECWICRDTDSSEPLIRPCACRGSMSSVHASCVEQWIRHHRRTAVNDEVPRCSVCHQPYTGYESRPGVGGFVRHLCYDTAQQLMRTVALVFVLFAYQTATDFSDDAVKLPMGLRVVILAFLALVALHKTLLLTVSLPPHRPAPQNPYLRHLFVGDYRKLAMHIAEAFAGIVILGFWCLAGTLKWQCFVPIACLGVVPTIKILSERGPSVACVASCLRVIAGILLAPIILVALALRFAWLHPSRVVHPLDAGLHIVVAIVVAPMCLIDQSNVALVILWTVHSLLVALGLVEKLWVKRWQWKEGNAWWFALQLTSLDAYMANSFCEFPEGVGYPHDTNNVVRVVSVLWFLLVSGLAIHTNWALCLGYYRTWQHRNGTFRLEISGDASGAADGGEGRRMPAVAPEQV